ncbi:MAG: biotin--[acetyl-CoA-carboxylase] ligase [Anaerolineales bacterium]
MNLKLLKKLPIGEIRYFETIGSTNDEALAWATQGAPDLSLVIADEQTTGRGRLNRKWFTPKGTALALSLIIHPTDLTHLSRTVGLAALSIADACLKYGLSPQVKWPNDILLSGKKVAGILIETVWSGDKVDSLVIGMGINVHKESVPPDEELKFPATSLETELGQDQEREDFLYEILKAFINHRSQIGTKSFISAWENLLAFRNDQVQIQSETEKPVYGQLLGLETDGSLRILDAHGKTISIRFGDVSLRALA